MTIIFPVPGGNMRFNIVAALQQGELLRDHNLWLYPLLPGAVFTFQQIVSGRDWKVSASTMAAAQRASDWINRATTKNIDGTIERGFEQFIKRHVLDYLCVGRVMYTDKNDVLEYLDPCRTFFQFSEKPRWVQSYTGQEFYPANDDIVVFQPLPIGGSGYFVSPLTSLIPSAQLAWLIREHDSASADGRKIRDIIIVGSRDLGTNLDEGIKKSVALWSGADPTDNGVPIVYMENMPQGTKIADYITRLGIANIPESLDRDRFEFGYANEIAANIGLALRQFYNSERATNRALEEVQDSRQQQKGTESFIRSEERQLNDSGILKRRFGNSVRMSFIEEIDLQSQTVRGDVLKAYAEALKTYSAIFGGNVNGEAFLAWLQSENILPADLDLITELGSLIKSDTVPTTGVVAADGTPEASALTSGKPKEKTLDYGEFSVDSRGKLLERRSKVFGVVKIIEKDLLDDESFIQQVTKQVEPLDFTDILDKARQANLEKFINLPMIAVLGWLEVNPDETAQSLKAIREKTVLNVNDNQHRWITRCLKDVEYAVS